MLCHLSFSPLCVGAWGRARLFYACCQVSGSSVWVEKCTHIDCASAHDQPLPSQTERFSPTGLTPESAGGTRKMVPRQEEQGESPRDSHLSRPRWLTPGYLSLSRKNFQCFPSAGRIEGTVSITPTLPASFLFVGEKEKKGQELIDT